MLSKTLLIIGAAGVLSLGIANANPVSKSIYIDPLNAGIFQNPSNLQDFKNVTVSIDGQTINLSKVTGYPALPIGNITVNGASSNKSLNPAFTATEMQQILKTGVQNVQLGYVDPAKGNCTTHGWSSTWANDGVKITTKGPNGQAHSLWLCIGTHI